MARKCSTVPGHGIKHLALSTLVYALNDWLVVALLFPRLHLHHDLQEPENAISFISSLHPQIELRLH
jgi:hypothetical protein